MAENRRLKIGPRLVDTHNRIGGLALRHIEVDNLNVIPARAKATRPELTDSVITDVKFYSSHFNGCVFRDVEVNGIESVRDPLFVTACDFTRVSIRGEVKGGLILSRHMYSETFGNVAQLHNEWITERLLDSEWMLDISEALGTIVIRGYPSRMFRLNPERHAVVAFESASRMEWKGITRGTAFGIEIGDLLERRWEDTILIANPLSRRYKRELEAIQELKDLGVAY